MAAIIVASITMFCILNGEDSYVAVIHYTRLFPRNGLPLLRRDTIDQLFHSLLSFST